MIDPQAVRETLQRAKALVTIGGWTQGAGAKDSAGLTVPCTDLTAVCFCMSGAIGRAAYDVCRQKDPEYFRRSETDYPYDQLVYETSETVRRIIQREIEVTRVPTLSIICYNDASGRTQAEVVAVLDEAIKQAEQNVWTKSVGA